jgi:hypothetical protein
LFILGILLFLNLLFNKPNELYVSEKAFDGNKFYTEFGIKETNLTIKYIKKLRKFEKNGYKIIL